MAAEYVCNVCDPAGAPVERPKVFLVKPNVRRIRDERFLVWRCVRCGTIHAHGEVDLDAYYRDYPFFGGPLDWRLRVMYEVLLRRLTRAGVTREQRILDYGCGGGKLVAYMRERGFTRAVGYDAYAAGFSDPALLELRYDAVVSQDVIEHVAAPWELLRTFERLVEPGGVIALGTPDAAAIDLTEAESFVHALHQPYHRHILSRHGLLAAGEAMGWELVRYYSTMYNNTLFPFLNSRFITHYLAINDDTIDAAFEPIRVLNPKLWTLETFLYGFLGFFFPTKTDVMAVFRAPRGAASG